MRYFIAATLLGIAPVATAVHAQSIDAAPETRVQVTVTDARLANAVRQNLILRGQLISQNRDSLVMTLGNTGSTVGIPWTAVRSVAKSRGVPSRLASGIMGMVGGALIGAIVAVPAKLGSDDPTLTWGRALGSYAGAGGAAGFVTNFVFVRERWKATRIVR